MLLLRLMKALIQRQHVLIMRTRRLHRLHTCSQIALARRPRPHPAGQRTRRGYSLTPTGGSPRAAGRRCATPTPRLP